MILLNFLMPCMSPKRQDDVKPLYNEKVQKAIKKSRPFDCFQDLNNMKEPEWGKNENYMHK
jgi:hypothetical protein